MENGQYTIRFGQLSVGVHDFELEVDQTFFNKIENSDVKNAKVHINAKLTKQNNLLQMHFNIAGTIGIECDRCIKSFDFPIETEENLVIKFGNSNESSDEILVINEGIEEFDLSQYIYEYITLAIPPRRVPCEIDEKKFKCDSTILDKLNNFQSNSNKNKKELNNPIWKELNKIKKYNKN